MINLDSFAADQNIFILLLTTRKLTNFSYQISEGVLSQMSSLLLYLAKQRLQNMDDFSLELACIEAIKKGVTDKQLKALVRWINSQNMDYLRTRALQKVAEFLESLF